MPSCTPPSLTVNMKRKCRLHNHRFAYKTGTCKDRPQLVHYRLRGLQQGVESDVCMHCGLTRKEIFLQKQIAVIKVMEKKQS